MDIISFNEASTANSRIESFIENPDSTSGIVTVPKVIASGETVTIPAGRVAVLPNVQVDGVMNIEGEVFVPSGSTYGDLDARIALKAPIASPAFTGNPTAPTQPAGNNSTRLATTAYVDGKMVLGTSVNSTSGTSIDFTGIPSWVKRITVMFSGVSTSGISTIMIQLGSTTMQTTGYSSGGSFVSSGVGGINTTSGLVVGHNASASHIRHGVSNIQNISGNSWVSTSVIGISQTAETGLSGGSVSLSGVLDRLRITTVNGTDTFDAGQINIMYEG